MTNATLTYETSAGRTRSVTGEYTEHGDFSFVMVWVPNGGNGYFRSYLWSANNPHQVHAGLKARLVGHFHKVEIN